jgi:hypothetical protein
LNKKYKSGGKRINHTLMTTEKTLPIRENASVILEKRVLMAKEVR